MAVRVVVAEDVLIVREGILRMLDVRTTSRSSALCDDLPGAARRRRRAPPDVVLTDIRMPPTGTDEGIRAALTLRDRTGASASWCCPSTSTPARRCELFDGGSERRAYLLKERVSDPAQLRGGDPRGRRAAARWSTPRWSRSLVAAAHAQADSALDDLTPARAGGAGRDRPGQEQRGRRRRRSSSAERAVEKHINSLFSKLGLTEEPDVHRRVKAVLLFLADAAEGASTTRRSAGWHPGPAAAPP